MVKAFVQRFIVPLIYPALRQIVTPLADPAIAARPTVDTDGNPVSPAVDEAGNPLAPPVDAAVGSAIVPKSGGPVKETVADKPSVLQEIDGLKEEIASLLNVIKDQGKDLNDRFVQLENQETRTKAITDKAPAAAAGSTPVTTPIVAPAGTAPAPALPANTDTAAAAAVNLPIPETPPVGGEVVEAAAPAPEKTEMSKKLFNLKPKPR